MPETHDLLLGDTSRSPGVPQEISVPIEVNGLKYLLSGQIPTEPDHFELVASLPDEEWHKLEPEIQDSIATNDWFAARYKDLQTTVNLGKGRVGSVSLDPATSVDRASTIHIARIQTELKYLPESSEYYKNSKGVGSAILDNLCAIADARGWRITLYPSSRDGRLDDINLQSWYERRGFKWKHDETDPDKRKLYPSDDMLRFPGEPDGTSPVLTALHDK